MPSTTGACAATAGAAAAPAIRSSAVASEGASSAGRPSSARANRTLSSRIAERRARTASSRPMRAAVPGTVSAAHTASVNRRATSRISAVCAACRERSDAWSTSASVRSWSSLVRSPSVSATSGSAVAGPAGGAMARSTSVGTRSRRRTSAARSLSSGSVGQRNTWVTVLRATPMAMAVMRHSATST